jgi:hypothetical protein
MRTMADEPRVVAWFVDAPVDPWDEFAAVKLRGRQLCDPHYQAGQRAARLHEAAALIADPAFDFDETWDAGLAAGLAEVELDSAANVALVLWKVERGID